MKRILTILLLSFLTFNIFSKEIKTLNIKVNEKNHLVIGATYTAHIVNEFVFPTSVIDENRINEK
mgnify:CR=1 FL=1